MSKGDNEGLSLFYRLKYRITYLGMHVFGPAQLGSVDDPHQRMARQRAAKVAAAKAKRLAAEGDSSTR